jgi:SPX domain protein involved in polyphosphate accumulation
MNPEWVDSYLDYDKLKVMIDELVNAHVGIVMDTGKGASLSVARPTNAAGLPENQSTQEQFFSFIEQEIRKIDLFTKRMVRDIRQVLTDCESEANALASLPAGEARETATALLRAKMEACGEDFLKVRRFGSPLSPPPPSPANLSVPPFSSLSSSQLEKYVNLNFTGFHKILKKHDRHLPNPCKAFYTARLHDQVGSPFHAAFPPPSLAATGSRAHARRPLHLAHTLSLHGVAPVRHPVIPSSCHPVILSSCRPLLGSLSRHLYTYCCQSWVRGDYSDVMVTMSRIYEVIRGDQKVEEKANEKQDFVRSTRKVRVACGGCRQASARSLLRPLSLHSLSAPLSAPLRPPLAPH